MKDSFGSFRAIQDFRGADAFHTGKEICSISRNKAANMPAVGDWANLLRSGDRLLGSRKPTSVGDFVEPDSSRTLVKSYRDVSRILAGHLDKTERRKNREIRHPFTLHLADDTKFCLSLPSRFWM